MAAPSPDVLRDRARGVVLVAAAGDALGAPYETSPELQAGLTNGDPVLFTSCGDWAEGEWTDDTAMAIPILEALAQGLDLTTESGLGYLAKRWLDWGNDGGKGIGLQTARVFARVVSVQQAQIEGLQHPQPLSRIMMEMARLEHESSGRSGGNGCLMRVGPLALGFLAPGREVALADAARRQALMTHFEPDGGDAAVIWSLAIRQAILTGAYDLREQLAYLPEDRRTLWAERLTEAEEKGSEAFVKNYWVVAALQCAHIANRRGKDVKSVLESAVRGLGDTDTIAAIAGQLAGARFGASSVPSEWREKLHGWPGLTVRDLEVLVDRSLVRSSI